MTSLLGTWTQVRNRAPVSYAGRAQSFLPGILTKIDSTAQLGAMSVSGTVFTMVARLAEATAAAPWCMETVPTVGGKTDPTPVPSHPALDLLRRPNPLMSDGDLQECVQQHIDLAGEGYMVVARGKRTNFPVELWPIRPDRMTAVPDAFGSLSGWVYTGPDGERVPLALEDVIQIKLPNPLNPWRGLGPLQSVLVDLDAGRLAAEWNRNFFLNSAQPGGLIEVDEQLSDAEFRTMTSRWREQHQGVAQAHRVAILEKGKWVDRNYSVKDMEFGTLREIPREVVREAFGYPKPMLGAVDDVNRANADAAELVFARWLLVPRLNRWQSALNTRLLPMFGPLGDNVRFCYESPVPEDEVAENAELTAKTAAAAALVIAGWNADDVLATVGLPPMTYEGRPSAPAPAISTADSPAA